MTVCTDVLNSHIHFVRRMIPYRGSHRSLIPPKSSDVQRYTFRGLLFSGIKTDRIISLLHSPPPQSVEIFLLSTELKRPTAVSMTKKKSCWRQKTKTANNNDRIHIRQRKGTFKKKNIQKLDTLALRWIICFTRKAWDKMAPN